MVTTVFVILGGVQLALHHTRENGFVLCPASAQMHGHCVRPNKCKKVGKGPRRYKTDVKHSSWPTLPCVSLTLLTVRNRFSGRGRDHGRWGAVVGSGGALEQLEEIVVIVAAAHFGAVAGAGHVAISVLLLRSEEGLVMATRAQAALEEREVQGRFGGAGLEAQLHGTKRAGDRIHGDNRCAGWQLQKCFKKQNMLSR